MSTVTTNQSTPETPGAALALPPSDLPVSGADLSPVEVREVEGRDVSHGWDEFVERHPGGTAFHLSRWRQLISRHFPHRPRYLEAWQGERRVGVLPLFATRSPLSGKALYSVPYGVYGGPLTTSAAAEAALLGALRKWTGPGGYRFAELRCRAPLQDGGLPTVDRYATFVSELPDDPEQCLARIPRKSRASTRQARDRHQLTFVEAPELLADFHRLFILNKQTLGSPCFSRAFFADLLAQPGVRLHAALRGTTVMTAVLSLTHGETFNPYYSGSLPEADRIGAANFVYWQLMCHASAEGFRWFDFGRSRIDTGPYHFKRHMGFEPTPLTYCYVLGAGQSIPAITPSNPTFSVPRTVLRKLPFPLARMVGPQLMKLVP